METVAREAVGSVAAKEQAVAMRAGAESSLRAAREPVAVGAAQGAPAGQVAAAASARAGR